jgi:hypothetical protein
VSNQHCRLGFRYLKRASISTPKLGDVISAHQVVGPPGESLSSEEVQNELNDFEKSLRQRHPSLDFLVVDPEDLKESERGMKVDIDTKSIVWPTDDGS